MSTFSN